MADRGSLPTLGCLDYGQANTEAVPLKAGHAYCIPSLLTSSSLFFSPSFPHGLEAMSFPIDFCLRKELLNVSFDLEILALQVHGYSSGKGESYRINFSSTFAYFA